MEVLCDHMEHMGAECLTNNEHQRKGQSIANTEEHQLKGKLYSRQTREHCTLRILSTCFPLKRQKV